MTKKMRTTLHQSFKRMNMGLWEFYQNITYPTTISDFKLLSLDF